MRTLLAVALVSVFPCVAGAATLPVTATTPQVADDGMCSLGEAIENANDDAQTHGDCDAGSGPDTLVLSTDVTLDGSALFPPVSGLVTPGDSGLPEITSDVTITGGALTRTGSTPFRFFFVSATGSLTLRDVTLSNGRVEGDCDFTGNPAAGCGGAILVVQGTLAVENVSFSGNSAVETTGADLSQGGAIQMFGGTLSVVESDFVDNEAEYGGAVFASFTTASIIDSTFTDNLAIASGGAIYAGGGSDFFVAGSEFTLNEVTTPLAFQGGGAIDNAGSNSQLVVVNTRFDTNTSPNGGALNNFNASDANLVNCLFIDNVATNGGAIQNRGSGATINVFSSTFVRNDASRGGAISNGGLSDVGTANIYDSWLNQNTASNDGGGIFTRGTLLLRNTLLLENTGDDGGGIAVGTGGGYTVTIESSTLQGNIANRDGGGLYYSQNPSGAVFNSLFVTASTFDGNQGDDGGGLYADYTDVSIASSTFSNNVSTGMQGGAGLHARCFIVNGATVDIVNSTFSGNTATANGGGLLVTGSAITATVDNTTIVGNTAGSATAGEGIHNLAPAASLTVTDSILDANGDQNCIDVASFGVTDGGFNISSDASCGFADTAAAGVGDSVLPLLGPLSSLGGETQTHPLLLGSPAMDAGSVGCPGTDQRGALRTGTCDVGAFEVAQPAPTVSLSLDEVVIQEGASPTEATVTLTLNNQASTDPANVDVYLRITGDATGLDVEYTLSVQSPTGMVDAGQVIPVNLTAMAGTTSSETFTITTVDDGRSTTGKAAQITASLVGYATFSGPAAVTVSWAFDECAANTDNCDPNATCMDTLASFTCGCNAGFEGSGTTCTDIDECDRGTDTCDPNATCANVPGSFTCTCTPGFEGDGVGCTDIDECDLGLDNCDANADCSNTIGSFDCTCVPGYRGDGATCTDIDECAEDLDDCDDNASCANTPGNFTCACDEGFEGDGRTCQPTPLGGGGVSGGCDCSAQGHPTLLLLILMLGLRRQARQTASERCRQALPYPTVDI